MQGAFRNILMNPQQGPTAQPVHHEKWKGSAQSRMAQLKQAIEQNPGDSDEDLMRLEQDVRTFKSLERTMRGADQKHDRMHTKREGLKRAVGDEDLINTGLELGGYQGQ